MTSIASRSLLASFARFAIVATATLLSACATTTTTLPAPPLVEAPLSERLAYYEQHRAASVQTAPLTNRRPWSPRATMTLASGDVIAAPVDLLPAIPAGSASARAAKASSRIEGGADAIGVTAVAASGVAVAGLTGFLAISIALLVDGGTSDTSDLRLAGTVLGITSLAVAGGGFVLMAVAENIAEDAAVERETAFFTYDRALKRRLALQTVATPGAP